MKIDPMGTIHLAVKKNLLFFGVALRLFGSENASSEMYFGLAGGFGGECATMAAKLDGHGPGLCEFSRFCDSRLGSGRQALGGDCGEGGTAHRGLVAPVRRCVRHGLGGRNTRRMGRVRDRFTRFTAE